MIAVQFNKALNGTEGAMNLSIDLEIEEGTCVALFGKSGAGKTTFLRILAGLDNPNEGQINFGSTQWLDSSKKLELKTQLRHVAFVFQDFALFPNMTVLENLLYASPNRDTEFIDHLLNKAQLLNFKDQKPSYLSAGQKQRVALVRSLAQKPKLLLLDEPLTALDSKIKKELLELIKETHEQYSMTTLMVSHDVGEICTVADRVLSLENGKITRDGKPLEVFINRQVSGKFQIMGQLLNKEKQDFLFILTILAGNEIIKVIVDEQEGQKIEIGDRVMVASKAFNPIVQKLE